MKLEMAMRCSHFIPQGHLCKPQSQLKGSISGLGGIKKELNSCYKGGKTEVNPMFHNLIKHPHELINAF